MEMTAGVRVSPGGAAGKVARPGGDGGRVVTDDVNEPIKVPSQPWGLYFSVFAGVVLVFGVVTWLLGLGPFAYRQLVYGTSQAYVLNMTAGEVEVTLDRGKPLKVKAESAERTPILGGTTVLVARGAGGAVIEEVEAFVDGAPVVYNVGGARCLVLSDVSSFYLKSPEPGVKILEVYKEGTKVVRLPHDRVIWPRETLRDTVRGAEGGVAWLEIVGCSLLEPQERGTLESYLNVQLTERKRIEQERLKAEAIRRAMMRGGGDAVDELMSAKKGARMEIKAGEGADAGVSP